MTAALAAEGCGGAMGPSAARVQRVQRVLPACSGRVQRVVVRRLSGDEFYMPLRGIKTIQPGCARGKCTPSAYGTSPKESVSRDFQVAMLPYKSRSLATPEGEVCSPLLLVLT